ncbi:MAG TPA: DNA-directed RNA polymerase subunit alpha [Ignavibacteria bacterium]|nr:DNA-directed RNA polymerase subunit alpha [Ignavibacteria bacterium]HQY52908.1 DNA-directed RNA polymerase subunit alpha [Ignavibacteria bacterium]HRB00344.1 DNA-directed RNA polymerase subunit alpha [Ignavibacteria bacterium]
MKINNFQMPESIIKEESTYTDTFGRFVMQPLERGYGVTLGNSLRRILISSLPGSAIIAIRVNDAPHEFTTLKGVVEDLSEIILNLKEVRFKDITNKSSKIEFNLKGQQIFTAQNIQDSTADFEVLNPEKHIATLNKDANLNIEIRMGSGFGYVPSDDNKQANLPLEFIYVDSIFSPVVKANYVMENTRVGKRTDYEKLTLEITTDGSINPEDALVNSARLMQEHIDMFLNLNPENVKKMEEPVRTEKDEEHEMIKKILLMPVDELDLSVRSQNCLRSANIKTISDLVSKNEGEMLHFRNFGRKSLAELGELIENFGLTFGMDVDKYLKEETPV